MSISPEREASYVSIIDCILATSDLNTISEKRIRKGLEVAVNDDLTDQKTAIKALIIARFDKFHAEASAAPSSPRDSPPLPTAVQEPTPSDSSPPDIISTREPRAAAVNGHAHDDLVQAKSQSATASSPPLKKKRRIDALEDDARLAAVLQAEENSRARPTRRATNRKPVSTKKSKRASGPKSAPKVEDDSSIESNSSHKRKSKVNRSGGFHKQLILSAPLSQLLGETTLSRPETVKRLWAYFKEHDLQDPKDKRQIRCDDALRTVFKQDRVHMFTMNKFLSDHLFVPEE